MQIAGRRQKLLDAMAIKKGEWLTRAQIAELLGSKNRRLTDSNMLLLELMAQEGVLEARTAKTAAPIGYRHEYRIP
jgi:uncharacterized protein HemY